MRDRRLRAGVRASVTHLATVAATKTSAFFSCMLTAAARTARLAPAAAGASAPTRGDKVVPTPISARRSRGASSAGANAWACDSSSTPNALTRSIRSSCGAGGGCGDGSGGSRFLRWLSPLDEKMGKNKCRSNKYLM